METEDQIKRKRKLHTDYFREVWYPKNRKKHILAVNKLKAKLAAYIDEYKRGSKCADCGFGGKDHPYVLDFDHRGDKKFTIAEFRKHCLSLENIKKEMSKCDLVCSNCHRIRTYKNKPK